MELKKLSFALWATVSVSCELPEQPYPDPIGLATEAAMGSNYENVVYFSLETDTAVLIRPRDAYDLRWDPEWNSFGLRLNSSGFGQFKRSTSHDFYAITDTSEFDGSWQWSSEGAALWDQDLGHWIDWTEGSWSPIFAVLPGIDATGATRPLWRIQMRSLASGIRIRFAPFFEPTQVDSVQWDTNDGTQFLHLDRGTVPRHNIEPLAWDFMMGQYVDQDTVPATGEIVPYVVRGVLIPPHQGAVKTRRAWNNLPSEWAYAEPLEQRTNAVGYDWKYYSFSSASYVTDTNAIFLLERTDASRYALRFLDFYNSQGQRGFVQTQWKPL